MSAADKCFEAGTHAALKRDPARWAELPRIGVQEDGEGGALEIRNCIHCQSSLAIEVTS